MKEKNHKRQLGQYRAMVRTQRMLRRWGVVFVAAAAIFCGLAFWMSWIWSLRILGTVATFTTVVQLANQNAQLRHYESKVVDLEMKVKSTDRTGL